MPTIRQISERVADKKVQTRRSFDNALAVLGAGISLMPYTMYEKLGLGEPKATRMSLELADRSIEYPRGMIENVLLKCADDVVDFKTWLGISIRDHNSEYGTDIKEIDIIKAKMDKAEHEKERVHKSQELSSYGQQKSTLTSRVKYTHLKELLEGTYDTFDTSGVHAGDPGHSYWWIYVYMIQGPRFD
ncbi:hypothetical protein Tco_1230122 [Tanacetum coccineum]